MSVQLTRPRGALVPILAAACGVILVAGGVWLYTGQRAHVRHEAVDQLTAISLLKAGEIGRWRADLLGGAAAAVASPFAEAPLRDALRSRRAGPGVLEHLRGLLSNPDLTGAILADSNGQVVASVPPGAVMPEEAVEGVRLALRVGRPRLTDLFPGSTPSSAWMDADAPLLDLRTGEPLGAVVLRTDAGIRLNPLIQTWPVASRTAETLLVRREETRVLFLNELRHLQGTALRLRFPLTATQIAAVQAALGRRGAFEGTDYRGVRVLSVITAVPDSPWIIVAKVDRSEAFSAMRVRTLLVAALGAAVLAIAGGLVMWRIQRARREELRRAWEGEREETVALRRAEEALRASGDRLRRIVDGAEEGLVVVKGDRIVLANPYALRLFGASAEEVARAHYLDFTWPEDLAMIEDRHNRRLAGEEVSHTVSYRVRRLDGTPVPVEAHTTIMEWEGGTASLVFLTDRSEMVRAEAEHARLEESLQQSRRLEAVGMLAGGVAHDFNNMLTAILGYAELLRHDLKEGTRPRADLEQILAAAGRSRDLVRQLLAFARRQTMEMRPLDLNEVIAGLQPMLRRTLREDVFLELRPTSGLPPIQGDRGQIEQVILNLAVNAQDAMPGGGTVLVETRAALAAEGIGFPEEGVPPGRCVTMVVSDTGSGMDPETLARVFEPFFTTKAAGRGTGLGLATVYGIMRQHRGTVSAQSEPGRGSSFTAVFPAAADGAIAPAPAAPVEAPEHTPRSGTVLVVEDQEQARPLVCEMLRRSGYTVLEAAHGEAALAASRSHAGGIDLLLTDVIMPGMNGKELHRRIREERPGIRVLYMSGYAANILSSHGVLEPGVELLSKPFTLAAFTAKVREVMERPAASPPT
jgi:PAS domain S-box-containing protein